MKKKFLASKDGRCPYPECRSDDVVYVGRRVLPRPMGSSTKEEFASWNR